ncbi:MAG: hypothetical protein JSV00_05310 [bacterium]|nr:MAG: hypothetical protein JSV00_05310 [bacterium]
MTRRKREIRKRKRKHEASPGVLEERVAVETVAGEPEEEAGETLEDSQLLAPTPPPREIRTPAGTGTEGRKIQAGRGRREALASATATMWPSWLSRNKENILLGLLVLYVLLLGLGTVGELFEVEWVLNLPLFR